MTLFGEYGLPAPKGLAVEFVSNSFALRLPRSSAWTVHGRKHKETREQEFHTAPPGWAFSLVLCSVAGQASDHRPPADPPVTASTTPTAARAEDQPIN